MTEDFPGRSFESFDEYLRAKKERDKLIKDLNNPKDLKVEISIEQEEGESGQVSN
jgi:uncharacterized membrane protein